MIKFIFIFRFRDGHSKVYADGIDMKTLSLFCGVEFAVLFKEYERLVIYRYQSVEMEDVLKRIELLSNDEKISRRFNSSVVIEEVNDIFKAGISDDSSSGTESSDSRSSTDKSEGIESNDESIISSEASKKRFRISNASSKDFAITLFSKAVSFGSVRTNDNMVPMEWTGEFHFDVDPTESAASLRVLYKVVGNIDIVKTRVGIHRNAGIQRLKDLFSNNGSDKYETLSYEFIQFACNRTIKCISKDVSISAEFKNILKAGTESIESLVVSIQAVRKSSLNSNGAMVYIGDAICGTYILYTR